MVRILSRDESSKLVGSRKVGKDRGGCVMVQAIKMDKVICLNGNDGSN